MSTLSTLEANSLKGALEALLLVSSDPVSAPALAGALDIAPGECASLLAELKVEYEEANRGFQGGYRLARRPEEYTVLEILELTEGGLFLVPCTKQEECCARSADCAALPLWKGLDSVMRSYLKGVTLADLVQQHLACGGDDYVI